MLTFGYADGDPSDCARVELFTEEIFPVISPQLARQGALQEPADLFAFTALYDTYWESDWEIWLASVGAQPPNRWRGLYFTSYAMAVDAAVAGQGVLIGHSALIEEELHSGKLIAPFDHRVRAAKRYQAIAHPARAAAPAVRLFLDWLRDTSSRAAPSSRGSCRDSHG